MQIKFIVSHEGQELGPFTEGEIRKMIAANNLLPIDYLYDEVKQDWILINERFDLNGTAPASKVSEETSPTLKSVYPTADDAPPPAELVARKTRPEGGKFALQPTLPEPQQIHQPTALSQVSTTVQDAVTQPMISITDVAPAKNTPAAAPAASASPAADTSKVTFSGGVGTVSLKQLRAGRVVLRLKDCSAPNLSLPSEAVVNVQAGPAKLVVWEVPTESRAGDEVQITAVTKDAFENPTTLFDGQLEVEVKGADTERYKIKFTKGSATTKFRWTKAGAIQVELNDPERHNLGLPAPRTMNVKAGPAAKLVLESPSQTTAGDNLPVTVRAVDEFGNLATDFKGEIAVGMTVEADKNKAS